MILNNILDISRCQWMPKRNDEVEGLGSGQILQADMATPLWQASVVTPITEFNTGRRIRGILNSLTGAGKSFEIYDPIAKYPANDPTGATLKAYVASTQPLVNPGFETGALTPWVTLAGYEITTQSHFGNYACRLDKGQLAPGGGTQRNQSQRVAALPGQTWAVRLYAKGEVPSPSGLILMIIYRDAGGVSLASHSSSDFGYSDDYRFYSFTAPSAAPANTAFVDINIRFLTSASSQYLFADDVVFQQSGNAIRVLSVSNGRLSLRLPANYKLSIGDVFQVNWGTNPNRQTLFEVSEDVTANGSGVTPLFKVFPNVLDGIAANDAVTLAIPRLRAMFVPGSIEYATADSDTWKLGGFSFQVMQKLS